jgi:hypothetical protein
MHLAQFDRDERFEGFRRGDLVVSFTSAGVRFRPLQTIKAVKPLPVCGRDLSRFRVRPTRSFVGYRRVSWSTRP